MDLKIVVLSKGRHSVVSTKHVVHVDAIVCPHNEADLYREYNKGIEIIPQPKDVNNIVKARQFVLDTFPNVFMIDDDVEYVRNFFNGEGEQYKIEGKQHVKDIIMQNAILAQEMGAKMFGFTHRRRPVAYYPQQPFRTSGFLNGSHCGFLEGHGLKYDDRMAEGEDYFMSCLNVFKHRFMLIDDRYGFMTTENFKNAGGCSTDRNIEIMKEDTLILREAFGEVVNIKQATTHKMNVREGERILRFPF